jgi:hypothetical protein
MKYTMPSIIPVLTISVESMMLPAVRRAKPARLMIEVSAASFISGVISKASGAVHYQLQQKMGEGSTGIYEYEDSARGIRRGKICSMGRPVFL